MSSKKKLIENFVSLFTLQGLNYLLPLITLPFLVRVLGPNGYGQIVFAQSLNQFFIYITDYGFNLSATKQVSINRNNPKMLDLIVTRVLVVKLILFLIVSLILMVLILFVPKFSVNYLVYILFLGVTLGNVLFPVWLFQGLEKMKYITILNITSKLIFTLGIFVFVKSRGDLLLVPVFYSLGFLSIGIISLFIIKKFLMINFHKVSFADIWKELRDSWDIFISTLAFSFYTVANPFILGLLTNNTIVGYYSSAEKLINAAVGLITPISDTVYPHINKIAVDSREQALVFIKKIFNYMTIFTVCISLVLFFGADKIIGLLYGNTMRNSVIILKIMCLVPMFTAWMNVFGVQTLVTFGENKLFSRVMIIFSIFNIIISTILIAYYGYKGTALGVLVTNFLIAFTLFFIVRKKRLYINLRL